MDKILLDSTILIKHFQDGNSIIDSLLGQYDFGISTITRAELLASKTLTDISNREKVDGFLQNQLSQHEFSKEMAEKAGELLRDLDISLAHATVAATALVLDVPLLTLDIKIFDQVPNLKLVDLE